MVCGFSLLLRCFHSGMHSLFIHVFNKYLFNSHSATLFPASGKDTLMQVISLISYTTPFNKHKWSEVTQSCPTLRNPARLLHPRDVPGKSTRVGCQFLLQGIFPIQGSSPAPSHCRQTLCHLSHQGSNPGRPHYRRFLTSWAARGVLYSSKAAQSFPSHRWGKWTAENH